MKFSIITPLYNKAPYIAHAIDSVFAQTCSDWEFIIMDDGSTDGSAAVVQQFLADHLILASRTHLLSQPNAGVAAARNNAVAHSQGDYLCFLDADDWWEPNYLEELSQLITTYPDAGLYFTNYTYYKPGKTRIMLSMSTGYINYPKAYYEQGVMLATSSSSMPRRVFDEMGGFPRGIKLGEDFLLWARTSMHHKMAYLDKPLVFFNNDVPPSQRATHHLYSPQSSMFFHLDELQQLALGSTLTSPIDWQRLLDRFRVSGLMDYWLSPEYHEAAKQELAKVDWSLQPRFVRRLYRLPIPLLRLYYTLRRLASHCKQFLLTHT